MKEKIRQFFLGKTLKDSDLSSEKFNALWGLPIYSSDAISSVSYAGEEILMVLVPVLGAAAYGKYLYCVIGIVILLAILIFSYRQTIAEYPNGGGAYIVARENLGEIPGLVAGASLTIYYILTVAVSSCAGAAAIVSAFPGLLPYKPLIAFAIVCILTWGNLRGMRESAVMFGVPTYFFVITMLTMIATGFVKVFVLGIQPDVSAAQTLEATGEATVFLMLRAFAAGCTALTGVEAVSNGVPNFQEPSPDNAKKVLLRMACIVGTIFVGVAILTRIYHIVPNPDVTAVAQLAAGIFGAGSLPFYIVQIATVIILSLAANTAFADLPLLMALMSRDGYMPRRYTQRGSRLNYSNGIFLLFFMATLLIVVFRAETHLLLALYATGVFVSFTLSQAGMFLHWYRRKEGNWKHKAVINGIGACVTFFTCIIIATSKFRQGAWIVLISTPDLVVFMKFIKEHYARVAKELTVGEHPEELMRKENQLTRVIVPLQSVNRSFVSALNYAMSLGIEDTEVYHVAGEEEKVEKLERQYRQLGVPYPLVIERTPFRNANEVLISHVDEMRKTVPEGKMLTVVMPQFVIAKRRYRFLHNHTTRQLQDELSSRHNVSVITIPFILEQDEASRL